MTTNITLGKVKSLYDTIDPSTKLEHAAEGKTVLITGAGRGKSARNHLENSND
jgi:hypothetical protein